MTELDFSEIAQILGISESTVRTHYSNAMDKIRSRMQSEAGFKSWLLILKESIEEQHYINQMYEEIMLKLDEDRSTILEEFPDEPSMADVEAQTKWAKENLTNDEYIKFFGES